jgi:hypothetical protein
MPEQASAVEVDMRPDRALLALLVLVGISFAQDTNFSVGPQYLVTTGSMLLMNPIATPSLSLSGETLSGTTAVPTTYEPPAFAPVETYVYLDNVYWGEHNTSEVLARRIEPPVMSPDQTAWYMNFVASQLTSPVLASAETTAPVEGSTVIELTGGPMPTNLPASILDVGAVGRADPIALQERRHEISLGDVAAYWKSHRRTAARVFTNADVTRLHG